MVLYKSTVDETAQNLCDAPATLTLLPGVNLEIRTRSTPPAVRRWVWGFVAIFFAVLAPALSWPEFSGDSEDLLVKTVLEMRTGGPWWVPTLAGVPRMRKPPLPAWITAAAVSSATVRDLDNPDIVARNRAYRWLAFEVRWPALLAGVIILLGTGRLAEVIGGPAHVLPAVLIGGSTLLLVRFVRIATTDVYLALWVTVANVCLAEAILRGRRWGGLLGAGVALGLAMLCKGPVGLIQTVVPVVVFVLMRKNRPGTSQRARWLWPTLSAIGLMLAIALPWFVITAIRQPNALEIWKAELNRKDHTVLARDPWYGYLAFIPNLLPWIPLYLGGFYISFFGLRKRKPIGLAFLLVIVPILILSFFHDRKDRYLLPLVGPTAILAAHAAVRLKRAWPFRKTDARIVWWAQWSIVLVLVIGLPIVGGVRLRRIDGAHWYSVGLVAAAVALGCVGVITGLAMQRRYRLSYLVTGATIFLAINTLFLYGWSDSSEGRSEMKPLADGIRAAVGGGQVMFYDPSVGSKPVTLDLDIYLNRIVRVSTEPITAASYKNAAAVVVLRKDNQIVPNFPGWRPVFDSMNRNHHWYVLTQLP